MALRLPPDVIGVWLAGVALAAGLALLSTAGRSWATALATAAVLVVAAYYTRVLGLGVGLVVLLIVTSLADRYTFPLGPVALRAEQVAALAGLAALAVTRLRERRWDWLKPNLPEVLLLVWFACGVASSLLASPDKALSAKNLALLAVSSLGLFLPRRLLAGLAASERIESAVRWLLIAVATEAAYGTAVYLLHVFGPTVSLTPNPASGHLSAYGTLWEQNVFGAVCAVGFVTWAYLGPERFRGAWLGLAACVGGVATSITRAAWLTAGFSAVLALGLHRLRRRLTLPVLARGAAAGLVLIVAALAVERLGHYTVQIVTSSGGGGGSSTAGLVPALLNRVDVIGRVVQVFQVLDDINGHLLLGRGTASFESLHRYQGIPEHVASLPLNVLDSTGLLGLAVFIAFGLAVFLRAWSARNNVIAQALGQAVLVVLITNLSTQTTELMIGWLLIGLLLAATDAARDRSRQPDKESVLSTPGTTRFHPAQPPGNLYP